MPSFSKPILIGLLAFSCCRAQQMDTVSWTSSGGFKLADLYFCCLPDGRYGYRKTLDSTCKSGAGPTIRLRAGAKHNLTIHNLCRAGQIDPETGRSPHTTNVHFHSLHCSGEGNMDNILRKLDPGNCMLQNYFISADHSPGTHWYHPHVHGSTYPQVAGGAFGMVIIENDQPAVSGYDANVKNFLTNIQIERLLLCNDNGMGNGNPQGAQISLVQNQWHYLRIVHIAPRGVGTQPAAFLSTARRQCQVYELATDGVFFSKVPYQKFGSPAYTFTLHAAGRLDLAVKCSTTGTFAAYQYAGKVVAYFTVAAGKVGTETPFNNGKEQWIPVRPNYLKDLRDSKYPAEVRSVGPRFTVELGHGQTINRRKFDYNVPTASFPYGPEYIQEFLVMNSDQHPYHMHQQHFQIVTPGGCGLAMREGEFYDTISDTSDNDCLVRFRNIDLSGKIIHHCHNLEHEDEGMMGWYNVSPAALGSFEASSSFPPMTSQVVCVGDAEFKDASETNSDVAENRNCPAAPVYPFIIMGVSIGVASIAVVVAVLMARRSAVARMTTFVELQAESSQSPIFHTPSSRIAVQA